MRRSPVLLLAWLAACEIVPPVALDNPWDPRNASGDADGDGFANGEDGCPEPVPTVCDGAFSECDSGGGACGCCNRCGAGFEVPDGWSCVPPTGPDGSPLGSPEGEQGRDAAREARHVVHLTHAFLIGQTEVTRAAWSRLVRGRPWFYAECGGRCPAGRVSWWEALHYANALSDTEGLERCYELEGCEGAAGEGMTCADVTWGGTFGCAGYRLPTEAEWEHAARAETTGARFVEGSTGLDCEDPGVHRTAWLKCNSEELPHPVAAKEANPWGLYDVYGNLREWVWDRYADARADATDPRGPDAGDTRVTRGGSFADGGQNARSAHRSSADPGGRYDDLGFRLARTVR